jgi:peptidyl-prolyl cis-trans isomerase C
MNYTQIVAITAVGLLLAVGCTKAETTDDPAAKPVAVVNGTPISEDVWALFVKTRHAGKTPGDLSAEEQSQTLDELVAMYVGAQEAGKKKLAEGEPNARIELVRQSAMAELLYKDFVKDAEPTEEELKAEYDARIAEAPKEEFHARHILVDDEAQAKDLIAQLDKGGDFAKLATEHSKDGSSSDGGDLGWFSPQQMVKPFSDAVQQLEIGKYTPTPVKSEFGWHVIKLEEKRPTAPPPFETVKAQLGPMVNQRKFEKHLDGLVEAAKVERTIAPSASEPEVP